MKTSTSRQRKNKFWHRLDKEMLPMLLIHRIVFYSNWTYQEQALLECRTIMPCQLVMLPIALKTTALWAMAACTPSWATKTTDRIATTDRIQQMAWLTSKIRTFIKNKASWATLSFNSNRLKPSCNNRPRSRCRIQWTLKINKLSFNNYKCKSTISKWSEAKIITTLPPKSHSILAPKTWLDSEIMNTNSTAKA